jgi:N-methylhydantoinase A
MLRIGIDIGGTFTDFVIHDSVTGNIRTFKLPSDPSNPAETVLEGLNQLMLETSVEIIHGSTVATNALLERKGANTALVTTHGFKDILQIGRQNRPDLYDWNHSPTPPLVPPELRFEVSERVDHHGDVLQSLDESSLDHIIRQLVTSGVESIAICFLFSFLHPQHEQVIASALRAHGFSVSASSEILPEYREYERVSTTVINAYVSPILHRYLSTLSGSLHNAKIQIMQSNGGMISLPEASQNGARCILSGPAGGIIGAMNITGQISQSEPEMQVTPKLITFDMGGTSTDVSLINGKPSLTTDALIGGFPIHLPLLDIHTIGAGGGSIAYLDAGGSLRVGPQSAGAVPGPACYGMGDLPTVTDANLVLGRLLPDKFLGGKMKIDPDQAYKAMEKLGTRMHLTAIETAKGVIQVVNAQMERALRVISVERGYDPRDFYLFSFGGAGGLHAVELARQMDISRLIISRYAATLSAYGMLASDITKDYVKTVMLHDEVDTPILTDQLSSLIQQAQTGMANEGISPEKIELQPSLDLRYTGQSYELNIPYTQNFISEFRHAHETAYGYSYPKKEIEIVNLRIRAVGKVPPIHLPVHPARVNGAEITPESVRKIELSDGPGIVPIYDYGDLIPGPVISGPVLIVSADTTIFIDKGDRLQLDKHENLIIDVSPKPKVNL